MTEQTELPTARRERQERLRRARVYVCADRRGGASGDLAAFLDAVLSAGVDIVQLRDKDATPEEAADAAAVFGAVARRHGALFIVNDDPELAVAAGADGVHVGQDDLPVARARDAVGPDLIVGHSTHSVTEIDEALGQDSDYLGVGPVRPTPTKEGRPGVGLGPVRHAAAVADRPFFVTGGMDETTAPEAIAAGAHGIVVVRALTQAAHPGAVAARLAALFA